MSQVILFDLDGTLTESGEGITKCVQYALSHFGIMENHLENLRCFVGPPLKEQFMSRFGFDEKKAEQAVEYYRERYNTIGIYENKLYPKIPELLELLKVNDKILGVASSKPETYVLEILKYFQIDQFFQVVVGSELDGTRTQKAEVIEEALTRLHMETERDKVLMVGDREHDVLGAKTCGVQCIGVAYGYGTREELEKAGAVYIADTVEDLGILASPNDEETTEHVESVRDPHGKRRERRKKNTEQKKREKTAADPSEHTDGGEEEPVPSESLQISYSPARQIWRMVYPILLHYGISLAVLLAAIGWFTWKVIQSGQAEDPLEIARMVNQSSLFQVIITSILAGGICFFLYRGDQRRRKTGFLGQGPDYVWDPPIIWFSVIVLAIAGSQLLNDLIRVLRLDEMFQGYNELAEVTMAGQPMWKLLLAVGILGPIAEELTFRGLIFRRMKDSMGTFMAVLLSSLLFGIYHGNVIQFIYAFLMGLVLAIIYHRTGTLWTAVLAHIAANLWSLFGGEWWDRLFQGISYGVWIGILAEVLLCVIPAYWIFGKRIKK